VSVPRSQAAAEIGTGPAVVPATAATPLATAAPARMATAAAAAAERTVFIEVLHRDGSVAARAAIDCTPFTIGRAYDNHLVVDDPHVAPHHLRIEAEHDGTLAARDLSTLNGLVHLAGGRGERVLRLALQDDTLARIGHTLLRTRSSDFTVAPEQPVQAKRWFEGVSAPAALLAAVALYGLFEAWIGAGAPRDTDGLVSLPLALVGMVALWGGGWALASRLFAHHAHFSAHLAIGAAALLLITLGTTLADTAAFAFGSSWLAGYSFVLMFGGIGVAVYAHLAVIQPGHPARSAVIAALVGVLAIGIPAVRHVQQNGTPAQTTFLSEFSWPRLLLRRPVTEDAFFESVQQLESTVDRATGDVAADPAEE
jgi:hypothetical protein